MDDKHYIFQRRLFCVSQAKKEKTKVKRILAKALEKIINNNRNLKTTFLTICNSKEENGIHMQFGKETYLYMMSIRYKSFYVIKNGL